MSTTQTRAIAEYNAESAIDQAIQDFLKTGENMESALDFLEAKIANKRCTTGVSQSAQAQIPLAQAATMGRLGPVALRKRCERGEAGRLIGGVWTVTVSEAIRLQAEGYRKAGRPVKS